MSKVLIFLKKKRKSPSKLLICFPSKAEMDSNVDWTWISVFWVLVAIIAVILIRQMKDNYYNMNYIFETKSDENGNHFWANNVPNYASFSAGTYLPPFSNTYLQTEN